MVTKYEFYYTNDFGDEYPAFCRENPKEPYGETYVLATDYAALEAERDALARRINPDDAPVDVAALCLEIDTVTDERDELKRRCEAMAKFALQTKEDSCYCNDNSPPCEYCQDACALIAIAEGRDNG